MECRRLFSGPTAALTPPATITAGTPTVDFTVTYSDDVGVDPASLGVGDPNAPGYPSSPADLTVNGPGGFTTTAVYVRPATPPGVQPTLAATYRFPAPGGRLSAFANGTYSVSVNPNAVLDQDGNAVPDGPLGTFQVNVPAVAGGDLSSGFGTDLAVRAMTVQADGKILVAGSETYARFGNDNLIAADGTPEDPNQIYTLSRDVLRRYNADGSLDTAFGGGDGRVVSPDGPASTAYAVAVQPGVSGGSTGKILVAGGTGSPVANFTLTRYNAEGTIDASFGDNGVATVDFDVAFTGESIAHAIGFQSDGKIILAGHAAILDTSGAVPVVNVDFALCRLDADGTLDAAFGNNGLVTTDVGATPASPGGYDSVGSLIVTATDQILVAGSAADRVGVARYSANGSPDASFHGNGIEVLSNLGAPALNDGSGAGDFHVGLARLANGDIVVASASTDGSGFAVTRLKADGSPNTAFGTGGLVTTSFGGTNDADQVAVLPSGKLLVLGTAASGGTLTTAAAAMTAGGAPDATFGAGGRRTFDAVAAPTLHSAAASATDASGNVLVARIDDEGNSHLRRLAGDYTAPTASLTPLADITAGGGTSATLTVTYSDDVAVVASGITNNPATAITVTGPSGPLTVSLVSVSSNTSAPVITATYSVAAPGGSWDQGDNGAYTIAAVAGKVADAAGNAVAAGSLGSFKVNIVPGAPTAALGTVSPITAAGNTPQTFTVMYTAASGGSIDASTIDTSDVTVARAGDPPLQVTSAIVSGTGSVVTATYTVAPPGGSWDESDNGDYVISVNANQVASGGASAAQFVPAAALGSFNVNVSGGDTDPGTPIGDFGMVSGKRQKATYTDADGTKITFVLGRGSSATGHATLKDGRISLVLEGTTAAVGQAFLPVLRITGKGGDGRVSLGDVQTDGAMKGLTAPAADVSGTLSINGGVRKAVLGNVSGTVQAAGGVSTLDVRGVLSGTLRAGGAISRLTIRGGSTGTIVVAGALSRLDVRGGLGGSISTAGAISRLGVTGDLTGTVAAAGGISVLAVRGNASGARVLAGANLGSDGQIGGTDAAADAFGTGALSTIRITGAATGSLFGAGLDPVNGVFLDGDDRVIGVADSVMRSISVKGGVDDASRFIAGVFGRIRAPGLIDPATDPRFEVL